MKDSEIARREAEVMAEINDPVAKLKKLESFMDAVAKEVKCLPNYADPSPDGNAHIMAKIRQLTASNVANNGSER